MHFKYLLISLLLFSTIANAAVKPVGYPDTVKKVKDTIVYKAIDVQPQYPGGMNAFNNFLIKNLEYPDLAKLIGISGKIRVSFVVDQHGHVTDVTPVDCLGAGCESEAAKVVSMLKPWKPGSMDNKPVRVQYTVPIDFNIQKESISMRELRNSDYGILFEIKGTIYTIDEAQTVLGKSFKSSQIEIALPYSDSEKYPFPGKKEVYCLKIKG